MIRTLFILVCILLLVAGCSPVLGDTQTIPNLIGNWTGTSTGHDRQGGYDDSTHWNYLITVAEQRDRAFNGTVTYMNIVDPKKSGVIGFSGAIGPDMTSIYMAEYGSGIVIGHLIDTDNMELIYLESGDDASANIDTLTRVT